MSEPATLVIKACAESIKQARDFVGLVFGGWGLEDHVARTVVSELATNAGAPRGALSYPRRSREELKGGSWVRWLT